MKIPSKSHMNIENCLGFFNDFLNILSIVKQEPKNIWSAHLKINIIKTRIAKDKLLLCATSWYWFPYVKLRKHSLMI